MEPATPKGATRGGKLAGGPSEGGGRRRRRARGGSSAGSAPSARPPSAAPPGRRAASAHCRPLASGVQNCAVAGLPGRADHSAHSPCRPRRGDPGRRPPRGGALHLARLAAWADRRDSGFPSRPGHRPSPFRAPHHCCCHWGSGGSQPDESGPPGGVSRVAFHPDDGGHPANQRGGSHGGAAVCHVPSGRHSRPGVSVRGSPVSYAQLTRSENVARQSWK